MPDTIAAIATAQLPSAIGILRLSGPDTRRILDVVFSPAHGGPISGQAPRRMVLGDLHDRQGRIIDSALAVLFPGPPQLHRGGLRREPLPRLSGGAERGTGRPVRPRRPAGQRR